MPNERSRLLFCIYFSVFCWKPYFTKYKSKWHYYVFMLIFTLMNYKWPNFWYLKCIFKLNVIIGCIYALFLFILSEPNMLTFFSSPHYKYLGILIYFRLNKLSCFFIESHSRYGFLIYGMFFVLFFGLYSDVFHCNNVSSKVLNNWT